MIRRPPRSTRTDTLFPYTTLFRSVYAIRSDCSSIDVASLSANFAKMAIPGAVQNMGNSVPTTTSVFSTCWLGKARRENNAQAALHREVHRFAGCFAELLQIWR